MEKVVYYARVSTQEEEQKNALQEQIRELEEFIDEKEDWKLIDKYIDEGKSGTTEKNRKEYQRLYDDLETDNFDIVVIKDETRLNRNVLNWYLFIDRLVQNKKKLYFYIDKKYYTPDDALLIGIRAIIANQFSRDLSKKISNAHTQRKKKGKPLINNRMWGYDLLDDGTIIINEKEAEIIRFIFDEYKEGKGFRTIQQELDDKGILNRNGTKFSMTTLKRIIKNEKFKGDLVSNKTHKNFETKKVEELPKEEWIVHKGVFPAIVREEIWEEANKELERKRATFKNKDKSKEVLAGYFRGNYVYSGKIFCSKCGKTYLHNKRPACKEDVWQCKTYTQFGTKEKHGCVNYRIPTRVLDEIVKTLIFNYWSNKEESIMKVINTLDKTLEENSYKDKVNKLSKEKIKLVDKKNKLIDLLTEELINKQDFKIQKENIDNRLICIDDELSSLYEQNKIAIIKKDRLLKIQETLTTKISKKEEITEEVIKCFLDKIIVKENKELDVFLYGDLEFNIKLDKNNNYHNVTVIR